MWLHLLYSFYLTKNGALTTAGVALGNIGLQVLNNNSNILSREMHLVVYKAILMFPCFLVAWCSRPRGWSKALIQKPPTKRGIKSCFNICRTCKKDIFLLTKQNESLERKRTNNIFISWNILASTSCSKKHVY